MTIVQKRDELIVAINRAGVLEAIREGRFDALCDDGETGDPRGQLKWRNGVGASYTPTNADKDTLIIFNEPEVTITFGTQSPGTSDTAWFSMIVNKGGKLTLVGDIIAYANHADQNVTIGIVRTDSAWVVSGTNIPEELS